MAADLSSDKEFGRRRVDPLWCGCWPAARSRWTKVRLLAYGEVNSARINDELSYRSLLGAALPALNKDTCDGDGDKGVCV